MGRPSSQRTSPSSSGQRTTTTYRNPKLHQLQQELSSKPATELPPAFRSIMNKNKNHKNATTVEYRPTVKVIPNNTKRAPKIVKRQGKTVAVEEEPETVVIVKKVIRKRFTDRSEMKSIPCRHNEKRSVFANS